MPRRPPDPAHEVARLAVAGQVARLLDAIAADRGCGVHHLSVTLTAAVENICLQHELERGQWDDVTPVVDVWHEEHPSKRPTRPVGLPKGVKRERR